MSTNEAGSTESERPPGRRRRTVWVAAGVVGLTGAVGLAAASVAALPDGTDTPTRLSDQHLADVSAQAAKAGADGNATSRDGGKPGPKEPTGKGKDGKDHRVTDVPCDSDQLIVALNRLNAGHGGTLKLARNCTYLLTLSRNGNGLPEIVRPVTIKGEGATILRAAGAPAFRIFSVGLGGDLTLRDLTVKGGFAQTDLGGGGLLVQAGGRATIQDSRITRNQSSTAGGGITNFGVTRILSGKDGKDGKDGKEHGDARNGSYGPAGPAAENAGADQLAPGAEGQPAGEAVLELPAAETAVGPSAAPAVATEPSAAPAASNAASAAPAVGTEPSAAPAPSNAASAAPAVGTEPSAAPAAEPAAAETGAPEGGTAGAATGDGSPLAEATAGEGTTSRPGTGGQGEGEGHGSEVSYNTAVSSGGGIRNVGLLFVEGTRLSHNQSGDAGGGLTNAGTAVVADSVIADNHAAGSGGGVQAGGNPVVVTTIKNSVVTRNSSDSSGGGIDNGGRMFVQDSTVSRNDADSDGGGIANSGVIFGGLVVSNSKVNENVSRFNGGGIANLNGEVMIFKSEVDRNRIAAEEVNGGGGVYNQGGTVHLVKSQVIRNSSLRAPGGVYSDNNQVTVDDKTVIIKNTPTNCEGSAVPIPNCFG